MKLYKRHDYPIKSDVTNVQYYNETHIAYCDNQKSTGLFEGIQ
jgi:hypothetical protein